MPATPGACWMEVPSWLLAAQPRTAPAVWLLLYRGGQAGIRVSHFHSVLPPS